MAVQGAARTSESYAVGIDIGGTFTDCILVDEAGASLSLIKVPSRRAQPERAAIEGLSHLIAESGISVGSVTRLGHGTTVATNTVIEENGAKVGVLVTRGFRDSFFLARLRLPRPADLNGPRHPQLIARRQVLEVTERMDAHGHAVVPLDEQELIAQVRRLVDEHDVRALAICFLHAYRNGAHELAAKSLIQKAFPDFFISCSHEVSPRPREYERFVTTVMNAYVGQRMRCYLDAFNAGAKDIGVPAPVLVTKANGGIMNVATAGCYAVHTMLSGPAAGVVGALHFAKAAGYERIITWDVGGTSLDISVIDGGIAYTNEARVGEHPLFIPTVDVLSIGAGGGSIGALDASGLLTVGPRSAGAEPGPACYGRGGTQATLTDAYVALGIVDPARFANGRMKLDRELAIAALDRLGKTLGLDAFQTGEAMLQVASAQMQSKFAPLIARYGVELDRFHLVPYGGAGATHCFLFAKAAGVTKVMIPMAPGLLCAWGSLIADLRYEAPRRIDEHLNDLDEERFNAIFEAIDKEASDWLDGQGLPLEGRALIRSAQIRYHGQSFEFDVSLPGGRITKRELASRYIAAYEARFGYSDPTGQIEIVGIATQAVGMTTKPKIAPHVARASGPAARHRKVYADGVWSGVPVFDRIDLHPGFQIEGPVVVDQSDTTTYMPAGFHMRVDAFGNLVGERS